MLCYGTMVHVSEAAAEETGVDAEIIDLRTLLPLDIDAIEASVNKTGRCVIVHEATLTSVRRRARGTGDGALLLRARGAGPAHRRLGYALSACGGMDYFPGPARVGRALVKAMVA